jgi:hypothetical protein
VKIELKRFTTNARLSQETTAFAADVWIDGKKAGHAENDGHGGCTIVHLDRAVRDQVEAYGKTQLPDQYKNASSGTEWVVDQLVEAELQKRADKSLAKRLVKYDAKEKEACEKQGLRSARYRHGDTWQWFAFKPGDDPREVVNALAAKHKIAQIDEVVVVSDQPTLDPVIEEARAAERMLATIAKFRRPTEDEIAMAQRAYAAAAALMRPTQVSIEHTTLHQRPGKRPIEFTGSSLFEVTATSSDGQSAKATIAADDDRSACSRIMLVQTTMKLRGQLVTYHVTQKEP